MEDNNEFKGTPFPWRIEFMGDGDFWVKSDYNSTTYYGTDILADDYGEHNGYTRDQRMADASLISKSPELLEQCQNLLGCINTPISRRKLGDFYPRAVIDDLVNIIDQILNYSQPKMPKENNSKNFNINDLK